MVYQPLLEAVENGASFEDIRALLAAAPKEETRGRELLDVIERAIRRRSRGEILKLLIEWDPSVVFLEDDDDGRHLLHSACCAPNDVLWLLLKVNPDAIHKADNGGLLPIHLLLLNVGAKLSTVQLLVETFPESLRMETREGKLPLHVACQWFFAARDYQERGEIVRFLVQKFPEGARVMDQRRMLPIHYCTGRHALSNDVISLLIGAFPQSLTVPGGCVRTRAGERSQLRAPLHMACQGSNFDTAHFELLLANPTVVHMQDWMGRLPLHIACEKGAPVHLVRRMIEMHPDSPQVQTNEGYLPLYSACYGQSTLETVQLLLELYPAGIHTEDSNGWLPIHRACHSKCDVDQIRLLVNADPQTLLRRTHDTGRTPLQLAFLVESTDETKTFLLEQQEHVVQVYRDAVEFMAGVRLDFADLVVDRIWQFAQPDVWYPDEDE